MLVDEELPHHGWVHVETVHKPGMDEIMSDAKDQLVLLLVASSCDRQVLPDEEINLHDEEINQAFSGNWCCAFVRIRGFR